MAASIGCPASFSNVTAREKSAAPARPAPRARWTPPRLLRAFPSSTGSDSIAIPTSNASMADEVSPIRSRISARWLCSTAVVS